MKLEELIYDWNQAGGHSNVTCWLEKHGIPASEALVGRIFDAEKKASRVLADENILALCNTK